MDTFDTRYGRELGEVLADQERGPLLVKDFCKRAIAEQTAETDAGPGFHKFFSAIVTQRSSFASEVIYRHAESPIERIFLGTMILSFLKSDPTAFAFTAPCDNAPEQIGAEKAAHQSVMQWIEAFDADPHKPAPQSLPAWLSALERKTGRLIPNKVRLEADAALAQAGYFESFRFTPQACFPDLRVENRSCRVDLLVWHPADKGLGVVVECDGYEFHNDKSSFERDRKRDRKFAELGYRVIRYSGSEIFNNPVKTSHDLYDLLHSLEGTL